MAIKKRRQSFEQGTARIAASFSAEQKWSELWKARGWVAPDRRSWADPFQGRREAHYAGALASRFGFVRFVGLPTQGAPENTPLESLFVEPSLSAKRIDPSLDVSEWPECIGLTDGVIRNPRLVVLGDPGVGKSTLISWIVLSLLAKTENRLIAAVGRLLPVILVLRDLDISGEITWDKLLARFIAHPSGQALGTAAQVEPFLQRGQAIVLVDGLDEAGELKRAVPSLLHCKTGWNGILRHVGC